MTRAERMSAVDTTWLRMDRPTNRMVIVGVLAVAGPVDPARLHALLASRLLRFPRFRQRVEHTAAGPWWTDDPAFDIARHIRHARLPGAAGRAELQEFVAELATHPLDPAHPLWQFHIVEDYAGGAAIVARVHHAIADGIALIGVMLSLTDDGPAPETAPEPTHKAGPVRALVDPFLDWVDQGIRASGSLLGAARSPARLAGLIRESTDLAAELAWLAAMPADTETRFKRPLSGEKRVAWCEPLPLAEVKAVGHALGCSVNDVLLAAVAGALRAYLREAGDEVDGVEIRAAVPVNLRPPEEIGRALGNHFGIVGVCLPAGIPDPVARVREMHRRMQALKQSREAPVTFGLMNALGALPATVQEQFFSLMLSRLSAVMTNVPGPQWQLRLGGQPIEEVIFWVPQSGEVGLGVSVLTYNGRVQFGLISDVGVLPDPQRVAALFTREFERIVLHVLMTA